MVKILALSAITVLAVTLAGCANLDAGQKRSTEQPEILLAQECGMDKLACCTEGPACSYSQQCCVDPNDPTRNYCSDQCSCGSEGEFCCKGGERCQDGLACHNGNCAACGDDGQICCDNSQCGNGLVCDGGKCSRCGVEGNICCAGNTCLDEDKLDETRTECLSGECVQCGSGGQPCSGDMKCIPGYLNNNGTCYGCGEANQPCCRNDSGKGYECNPEKYLSCFRGFCIE